MNNHGERPKKQWSVAEWIALVTIIIVLCGAAWIAVWLHRSGLGASSDSDCPRPTIADSGGSIDFVNMGDIWEDILRDPLPVAEARFGCMNQGEWVTIIGTRVGGPLPEDGLCFAPAGAHVVEVGTRFADNTEYTAVEFLWNENPHDHFVGNCRDGDVFAADALLTLYDRE